MPTSPQDLTTVASLKSYFSPSLASANDDILLQSLVTSGSLYFLNRCGGDQQTAGNRFNGPRSWNEWYDGNGGVRLFVRNPPITAVTVLQVDNVNIPQSTSSVVGGWVIDQSGKSIAIRGVGSSGRRFAGYPYGYTGTGLRSANAGFREDIQNVNLQYTGGYAATPPDVQMAINRMIAETFKKRGWIGLKSETQSQVGTTAYTIWTVAPEVEAVIQQYMRRAGAGVG